MRFPQGAEWLIILVLILVLFGAKRLPDAARGLGRSLRILKSETKGLHDDAPEAVSAAPADPAVQSDAPIDMRTSETQQQASTAANPAADSGTPKN